VIIKTWPSPLVVRGDTPLILSVSRAPDSVPIMRSSLNFGPVHAYIHGVSAQIDYSHHPRVIDGSEEQSRSVTMLPWNDVEEIAAMVRKIAVGTPDDGVCQMIADAILDGRR
jgi:hypothetical protein